jgi:hypothetical protein
MISLSPVGNGICCCIGRGICHSCHIVIKWFSSAFSKLLIADIRIFQGSITEHPVREKRNKTSDAIYNLFFFLTNIIQPIIFARNQCIYNQSAGQSTDCSIQDIDFQKNNFAALSVGNGRKKAYSLPAALRNEFSESL